MAVALDGLNDREKALVLNAYRRGHMAALTAVGLSFGLEPTTGVSQLDQAGTGMVIPAWTETPREL